MRRLLRSISRSPRVIPAAAFGSVCLLIVSAPVLLQHSCAAGAAVYLAFSLFCHQISERSFALFGCPLPVCHRCAGLYCGMLLTAVLDLPALHRSARIRRVCITGAAALLAADALASLAGVWNGNALSRSGTGLLFGTVTASVLIRGVAEFLREQPWRRFTLRIAPLKEASNE